MLTLRRIVTQRFVEKQRAHQCRVFPSSTRFPLLWMIDEAVKHGLTVNPQTVNQLAWGIDRKGSPFRYVAPDIHRDPHRSLTAVWRGLEWMPKSDKYKEWSARRSWLGYYIPNAEPRTISLNAFVHESVVGRMKVVPAYRPINLPESYEIFPMSTGPTRPNASQGA